MQLYTKELPESVPELKKKMMELERANGCSGAPKNAVETNYIIVKATEMYFLFNWTATPRIIVTIVAQQRCWAF